MKDYISIRINKKVLLKLIYYTLLAVSLTLLAFVIGYLVMSIYHMIQQTDNDTIWDQSLNQTMLNLESCLESSRDSRYIDCDIYVQDRHYTIGIVEKKKLDSLYLQFGWEL